MIVFCNKCIFNIMKVLNKVDQTPGGELASRLRELFTRPEPTLGFFVKVVERPGRSLQGLFPLTTLWEGASCGRTEDCTTCYQGADILPNCTRQSILYENVCTRCVPGAVNKEQVKQEERVDKEPALYVGETIRSIRERSKKHWKGYAGSKKEENHMYHHQQLVHGAEGAKFT